MGALVAAVVDLVTDLSPRETAVARILRRCALPVAYIVLRLDGALSGVVTWAATLDANEQLRRMGLDR